MRLRNKKITVRDVSQTLG
uniref:Uncharacterized protein n=1 Tax=Anguilla anguilla TaxID=7936 RepID=A0A0E9Q1L9_ANGAN